MWPQYSLDKHKIWTTQKEKHAMQKKKYIYIYIDQLLAFFTVVKVFTYLMAKISTISNETRNPVLPLYQV